MGCGACMIVRVIGSVVLSLACQKNKEETGELVYKCDLPAPFRSDTNKTMDIQLQTNTLSIHEKRLTVDVEVRKDCNLPEPEHSSFVMNYDFRNVLGNVNVEGSTINRIISDAELEDSREDKLSIEQTFTIFNNQSFQWNNVSVTIDVMNNEYIQNTTLRIGKPNTNCKRSTNAWICQISLASNSTTSITVSTTIIKNKLANFLQSGSVDILSKLKIQLSPDVAKEKSITTVISLEEKQKSPIATIFIAIAVALLVLLIIAFILYKMNFFKRKNKEELEELKKELRNRSTRSGASSDSNRQAVDSAVEALPEPDHDFDMVDLIVDETPLEKSLSSEQLNCLAANPDAVKMEDCPKKQDSSGKNGVTHF